MLDDWFLASLPQLGLILLTVLGIYVALILFTRLAGLRSFSKMSSFDFALTVAIGSVIASTVVAKKPPLLMGVMALASIYLVQMVVSYLRRFGWACDLVDNQPLLLMTRGEFIEENMRKAKVTEADLRAKLREANVLEPKDALAVIMESTGDVSVLHSDDPDQSIDPWLLEGVGDAERHHAT